MRADIVQARIRHPSLTQCRHGGSTVSQYLRQELHGLLESADKSHIPEMYQYVKELGGYFKRFDGGLLSPWVKPTPSTDAGEMDLHARATLTFFEVLTFGLLSFSFEYAPDCYFHRLTETLRQKLPQRRADPPPRLLSSIPWIALQPPFSQHKGSL